MTVITCYNERHKAKHQLLLHKLHAHSDEARFCMSIMCTTMLKHVSESIVVSKHIISAASAAILIVMRCFGALLRWCID